MLIRVNWGLSGEIVFKVATFGLEASVKISLPLLSAYYAVSITRWSSLSHADTMQIGQ